MTNDVETQLITSDGETIVQSDDYASLTEVLIRRFALGKKCEDDFLPDLFIID